MRSFNEINIAVAGTGYVGLSIATLLAQHHKVTAVDVDTETSRARLRKREAATNTTADRIEQAGDAFHARLRQGFLEMAAQEPNRIVTIDASGTPDEVWEKVWKSLTPLR